MNKYKTFGDLELGEKFTFGFYGDHKHVFYKDNPYSAIDLISNNRYNFYLDDNVNLSVNNYEIYFNEYEQKWMVDFEGFGNCGKFATLQDAKDYCMPE